MAPSTDPSYFPSLDRCLAGNERLISWKTAYRALCDVDTAEDNTTLQHFLNDDESLTLLSTPLAPWPRIIQGQATTKSKFETKTAPIHIAQSAGGNYNLDDIRKDALWLSEELKIDESVALRVAILEWQQRAADQLLANPAESRTAVVKSTDPRASFLASTANFNASSNGATSPARDPGSQEVRRDRMLHIYIEERGFVLKLSADLVSSFASRRSDEIREADHWIRKLAANVANRQCSPQASEARQAYLLKCIDWLDKTLKKLGDVGQWPQVFRASPSEEDQYVTSILLNISDVLRLIQAQLSIMDGPPGGELAAKWFHLMSKERYKYLQELGGTQAVPDVSFIQCLASAVSLAMLQLQNTIQLVTATAEAASQSDGVTYPRLPGEAYITREECIKEINPLIFEAVEEGYEAAAPAAYAWALIITCVRDNAARLRLSRGMATEGGDDGSSDTETGDTQPVGRSIRAQQSKLEKQWELIQRTCGLSEPEARADPAITLLEAVVGPLGVYSVIPAASAMLSAAHSGDAIDQTSLLARESLVQLCKEGFEVVPYSGEVLEALFTVFAPSIDSRQSESDSQQHSLVLSHGPLPYVADQAIQRYPYELSPCLRTMAVMAHADSTHPAGPPDSVQRLENMNTVTVVVPYDFRAFRLENEEANTNEMVLTDTLPLFVPKKASFEGEQRLLMDRAMNGNQDAEGNVVVLPAGTVGYIVKEDRPYAFQLEHKHSGLEYLGLLLSTMLPSSELVSASPSPELDRQTASEIVMLFNALISASLKQHQGVEEAKFVLGRLSFALPNEQDIITVIADIFELELLAHIDQAAQEGSLELVVASAQFFDALVDVSPERVWSILGRSSLLGINGGASALAAVVGGTEVQIGHFRFLAACTRLYSRLIDDAIAGLVKRRAKALKATNRFDSPMQFADSTPERTISAVLTVYQRIMLDAFQNMAGWRFAAHQEKQEVAEHMMSSFEALLHAAHGLQAPAKPLEQTLESKKKPKERIATTLLSAADMVVQAFAPEVGTSSLLDTVAGLFAEGLAVADDLLPVSQRLRIVRQVRSTCLFFARLLRTARTTEAKHAAKLATELLKNMQTLAKLFVTDQAYKLDLSVLLREMVEALASGETDPPSLLGPLSPESAKSFLAVISQLDRPLCDVAAEMKMWDLFTAVLEGRQQWFSIYLLTGAVPKARLKDSTTRESEAKTKSVLAHALDELAEISRVNPRRAKAMLRFVAAAQSVWVWATVMVRSHSEFIKKALDWLNALQTPPRTANNAEALIGTNELQMAAYLCDVLAVNLHASLETGDKALLKLVTPKLGFLKEHAATVNAYNRSLHRNLTDNLARKFPQCDLADFKRTPANPAAHGSAYCYDMEIADIVFGHEELAWEGNEDLRTQGFAAEVMRANINLSLVDAQQSLLRSWKQLATTLAECVGQDSALQPALVTAAKACLRANVESKVDEPGTAEMLQMRADLAFMLLSKLVGIKSLDPAMKDLLPAAWDLVRTSPADYDVATAPEDLEYYRALLQILYLAVRPHCYMPLATSPANARESRPTDTTEPKPSLPMATAGCLVEIVNKTIAPGFRALCANLHTDLQLALPGDFALITALLQAVLSVQGVHIAHLQIADGVAGSNIVRGALSLYSWSDQLAEVMGQDPVYGEMAITFLLALSSVRPIAEQIALDGVLAQLSSANLSNYFRKPGGKGPFDEPSRMFSIWTDGFLTLCLNLLDAIGPPIAGEVAGFLNSFPEQLERAEDAFKTEAPGYRRKAHSGDVTLGLLREVRSLVMIGLTLQSDIARAAAEGINAADIPALAYDLANAKAEVEKLSRTQRSLADKTVATNEREAVWARTPAAGAYDNKLQAMVVGEVVQTLKCFGE